MGDIRFQWYDYATFSIMIAVSVVIGVYMGFWKRQDNKDEYLLGGKSMAIFPVTISLISSIVSGITLMAYPADIYKYGSNLIWLCLTLPLISILYVYVFLPVLLNAEVTNLFEYFEKRFHRACRILASLLSALLLLVYNPIVIYIPCLAFKQASGLDVLVTAPIICMICVFYTTIGGLKAVIWTDTFQFFGMVLSSVAVVVIGIIAVGGIEKVWQIGLDGERLDIFEFNLTIRDNFWSIIIGATFQWASYIMINQGFFQKCRALPTLSECRPSVIMYGFGAAMFMLLMVASGNIMYAKYSTCDPISSNQVFRDDQLLPYFVLEISKDVPGLPGIFVAGIFSAALSTFSSTLNTAASIIYEDFLSPFLSQDVKEHREGLILKVIVVSFGIVSTSLVLIIQMLSELLPFITATQGIINGPLLGLLISGILIPTVNEKGALAGSAVALALLSWITFGGLWYNLKGASKEFLKPTSVEGCKLFNNTSMTQNYKENVFVLYRISFWYITVIGVIITVIVAIIVSLFTKRCKSLDKSLISTLLYSK